jgi:GntR family transcriptional regulator
VTSLKHERIAAELERDIRAGRMVRGLRLPGETALADRFAVSRNTVRAALRELSDAGLIATRSGKGSFVTYDGRTLDVRAGWTHALRQQGVDVETVVLRLERILDDTLARELGIASADFIAIDRVRAVPGGAAISFERSRIPVDERTVDIPEAGLTDGSVARTLEERGLLGVRGEQRVNARSLTAEEGRILGRDPSEWFLHTVRTSWSAEGRAVEHVDSVLDPIRFEVRMEFGDD